MTLQNIVLRDLISNIGIYGKCVENDGVSFNICDSVFQLLVRNGCNKGKKS